MPQHTAVAEASAAIAASRAAAAVESVVGRKIAADIGEALRQVRSIHRPAAALAARIAPVRTASDDARTA